MKTRSERSGTSRAIERGSWMLAAAIALLWLGITALVPVLPLSLESAGVSAGAIGLLMGVFHLGSLVASYGGGRLCDRVGARTVGVGALGAFAVASVGLACADDSALLFMVACRTLQGAGAGAALVAALSLVSTHVPLSRRARNFAVINGARVAGLAVGPVIGGAFGASGRVIVPAGAATVGVLAMSAVVLAPFSGDSPPERLPKAESTSGRSDRAVTGVLLLAVCAGLPTGLFESVWTLFLEDRGASSFEVGLTYPLFAVPFVLAAVPAGRYADERNRHLLAVVPTGIATIFCGLYPFTSSVALLVAMVVADAVLTSLALPSMQSLLTEASGGSAGRSLGTYALCMTAATAVAATFGGVLYEIGVWVPFVAMSGIALVVLAFVPALISGLPTRARREMPLPATSTVAPFR